MDYAGIRSADLSAVAFYENMGLTFQHILTGNFIHLPESFVQFIDAAPDWITNKLWIEKTIRKELDYARKIYYVPHHLSHAATAFYPSPFQDAAILTIDGVGEWSTMTWGIGENNGITIRKSIDYPHSLGLLYSAFTYYTGFQINNGEYQMIGTGAIR